MIVLVTLLTFLVVLFLYKQLLFTTFDKEAARVYGVPTEAVDTLFSLLLAAAIIVSMNVIGVTLIVAAIVIPASSARMLMDSFNKMILISVAIGSSTSLIGMFASFYLDAASGATIVRPGQRFSYSVWTIAIPRE